MLNSEPSKNEESENFELPKVNADIDTKKHIFIHWCSFLVVTLVYYLSLLAIPNSFVSRGSPLCEEFQGTVFENYSCQEYSVKPYHEYPKTAFLVTGLEDNNIFLIAYLKFKYHSPGNVAATINFTYWIQIYDVDLADQNVTLGEKIVDKEHYALIDCEPGPLDDYLDCSSLLLYYPDIEHSNYLVYVGSGIEPYMTIDNSQKVLEPIQNIHIEAYTVAAKFTESMLGIRYTFFAVSSLAMLFFFWRMLKLNKWQLEQKLVAVLTILQPAFNDPFYAITVHAPNMATAIIGVMFVVDFVCFLSLYHLVQFHRIVYENGERDSKALDWKKLVACGLMWIFMFASYAIMEVRYFVDPSDTYENYQSQEFMAVKIIFFLIVAGIFAWMLFFYIQFCRFYDSRLWRYKQIGIFSIYFVVSLQIFLFLGSFTPYQFDGQKVLLAIGILNLYIFYLQYLWMPSKQGLEEQSQQRKSLQNYIQRNQQYENISEPDVFVIEEDNVIANNNHKEEPQVEMQDINVDEQ